MIQGLPSGVVMAMIAALNGRNPGPPAALVVSSHELEPGATIAPSQVYDRGGCTGGNISPSLAWTGAPAGTRSFAITVFDPDAPNGGKGWWHWIVYDIPPVVTSVPAGSGTPARTSLPVGAREGPNDFGTTGYGGPCPPPGNKPHRYIFTVYALDVATLDAPHGGPAAFGARIKAHAIAAGSLLGKYGR